MIISMIVAMAENNVIGVNNDIPWHLPSDLKHFKDTTRGHTVIMGRRTWDSLPFKPLPKRRNLIISSNDTDEDGAEVFPSLEAALGSARTEHKVFIIGGEQLYRSAMPVADELVVSHILSSFEGDRFFPEIQADEWSETTVRGVFDDAIPYKIATYNRVR